MGNSIDNCCPKCGCKLYADFDYCPYCGEAMLSDEEKGLFEVLRKLRMRLAKVADVPPYIIFHDKTLREITKKRPQTIDELMEVPGVGKVKAAKYGEFIIDEIKEYDD